MKPADITVAATRRFLGSKRGVTLVELLVAVALLALLASFLSSGIVFGRRAWERSERQDDLMVRDAAVAVVVEQLQRAIPWRPPRDVGVVAFEGTADRVSWTGRGDPEVETGGPRRVTLVSGADGRGMVLLVQPFISTPGAAIRESRHALPGLEGVTLRYFGSLEPGAAASWRDTWHGAKLLPVAVELSFRPQDAVGADRLRRVVEIIQ